VSHPAEVAIGEHADQKPTRRMGMRGSPGLTLLSAALGVMMVALLTRKGNGEAQYVPAH
jgi:hypothetical protein